MAQVEDKFIKATITRYDSMPKPLKVIFIVFSTIGIGLFIFYMFGWNIRGYVLLSTGYYYLLYAVFGFNVFVEGFFGQISANVRIAFDDSSC